MILRTLILLFLSFAISSHAGPNKDLRCQDWLNGTKQTYLSDIDRVVSYDQIGIKGVCRDFYPSWGERFKLERTNSDFFRANYQVTRQYCWARNIIWGGGTQSNKESGKTYCGGCRMKFLTCKNNGWFPPRYTSWGQTYSAYFDFDEVAAGANGFSVEKTMKKGSLSFHHVCLRRYQSGEKFLHDESTEHKSFLAKVCAYIVNVGSCNSPLVDYGYALIGCVDEPKTPGPGVFNKVIIGQSIAFIDEELSLDNYVNLGSTFDQPLIRLTNGLEEDAGRKTLMLRYKFPGDTRVIDNTPVCAVFPDDNKVEYCAKFDTSNPGSICACVKKECDSNIFIGCVPRPDLAKSNLRIKTEYRLYEDEAGGLNPALGVQFVKTDSAGNELETLPLTQEPLLLREYFKEIDNDQNVLIQRDSIDVYGVKLVAMIPEFENDLPKYIGVGLPELIRGITGCFHFAAFDPNEDDRWPIFYVPAGQRDRDHCICPENAPDEGKFCIIPPPGTCIDGSTKYEHDQEAVEAYCTGYYTGFDDVTEPDQICVENDTDFDFISQTDGLCATLNTSCAVSSFPSVISGNALFATAELARGQSEVGECDPATGFEYALDYSNSVEFLDGADSTNIADSLLRKKFTDQFAALTALFESRNLNIPQSEIDVLQTAFSSIVKINAPEVLNPIHVCEGNGLSGEIRNACRVKLNCDNITKPSYSFFGATFVNNGSVDTPVAGTCTIPFKSEDGDIPNMQCVQVINNSTLDNHEIKFTYWDKSTFLNPCDNPPREESDAPPEGNQSANPPAAGSNNS